MTKKILVTMNHERGYDVEIGGKVYHVHALVLREECDSKNFACPIHGKGASIRVRVMIEEFSLKSFTIKKIVEKGVKKFLGNRKFFCKSCM